MNATQRIPTSRFDWALRSQGSPQQGDAAENEDNYLLIDGNGVMQSLFNQRRQVGKVANWPRDHWRLAILDGMGGHGCGREVAEFIVTGLMKMPPKRDLPSLDAALADLHLQVQARFADAAPTPGATLLLLEAPTRGPGLLYHVGDSRLFALRPDGLELLTIDHSPPTAYALKGLLSAEEWHRQVLAENRRAISQAFGLGSSLLHPGLLQPELSELTAEHLPKFLAHLPDRRTLMLEPGTTYLMATDGLWSYRAPLAFLGELAQVMRRNSDGDLEVLADTMLLGHGCRSREEPVCDNTTFIVFRPTSGGHRAGH